MAKYVLTKSSDGQFYFTLRADNGERILTSEMYKAKAGALSGIESVKKNSADDARYDRKTSKAGKPYFVLRAANNEVIGSGEEYSSEAAREDGIGAVKREGPMATTDDQAM